MSTHAIPYPVFQAMVHGLARQFALYHTLAMEKNYQATMRRELRAPCVAALRWLWRRSHVGDRASIASQLAIARGTPALPVFDRVARREQDRFLKASRIPTLSAIP